jgi:ABC-2 type transport system ATP-binding protein
MIRGVQDGVAIHAEGLSRRFGATVAVDELSFEVRRGETVGLLGHNGAGKTTTIRLLNGVLARDGGSARVLGFDPVTDGTEIRARSGVLTETPSLDERLTAAENLAFYGRLYGVTGARLDTRVTEMLSSFGLADRRNDRVGGFSRGMKQRVAIARTMLHDPEILFLDEPTAALDPVATREVHGMIDRFRDDERRTVVLTTHNLAEAQRLCDRVVIMRGGRALAIGTPAELARGIVASRVIEIEIDPAQADVAVRALSGGGVTEVSAAGEVVRARVTGRDDIPGVVRLLANAGVAVYRLAGEEPDLEAAYFALHAPADRADRVDA